ncbi:MAG: CPBP family intramembrane metalloprotease [Sandaracinaceae bacterium]|nr:CPBP family intramembrane metalloprotease [Sandaracinaceae bacterium]
MSSRDRVIAFILATYLTSGMLALTFHLLGMRMVGASALVVGGVYMCVPFVVALALQRIVVREPIREGLAIHFKPNRWFVVALLVPLVLGVLSLGVALLLPGVSYAGFDGLMDRGAESLTDAQRQSVRRAFAEVPVPPILFIALKAIAGGPTLNALVAFGEEAGWRGFLYRQLRGSFLHISVITGVVWGLWHLPLVLMGLNTTGPTWLSMLTTLAFAVLLAPLFTYVRAKSGSTVATSIFHGMINATASMSFLAHGPSALVGPTALAGLIALVILNAVLFFYDLRLAPESLIRRASVHTNA